MLSHIPSWHDESMRFYFLKEKNKQIETKEFSFLFDFSQIGISLKMDGYLSTCKPPLPQILGRSEFSKSQG